MCFVGAKLFLLIVVMKLYKVRLPGQPILAKKDVQMQGFRAVFALFDFNFTSFFGVLAAFSTNLLFYLLANARFFTVQNMWFRQKKCTFKPLFHHKRCAFLVVRVVVNHSTMCKMLHSTLRFAPFSLAFCRS